MLGWDSVVALIIAGLAVMGSPGPSTVSLTAVAGAFGVRRSLPYFAGLVVGTCIVLVVVALGLTAALLALPGAGPALITGAIAYILYLAYRIATAPPLDAAEAARTPPAIWGGIALGAANPKAYVAIAAVFAANRVAADPAADGSAKTIILAFLIVVIHAVWLVAGAALASVLRDRRLSRIVNVILAVAMVALTLVALWPKPA